LRRKQFNVFPHIYSKLVTLYLVGKVLLRGMFTSKALRKDGFKVLIVYG